MVSMDIPDQKGTTEIARAYLKKLRQSGSDREQIQKPEVQAWLEVENRLMLSEPDKPKAAKKTRRVVINAPKKAESIWKRPISDLWR